MLAELTKFVQLIFPSIDPSVAKPYLKAIQENRVGPHELFSLQITQELSQGDILEGLALVATADDGSLQEVTSPAIVVSNSCEIDKNRFITVAMCRPFSAYLTHPSRVAIERNEFFSLLYFPVVPNSPPLVADFSIVHSVSREFLLDAVARGSVKRLASLTVVGWYFFLLKLTVYFLRMRAEDEIRLSPPPKTPWQRACARVAAFAMRLHG